MGDGRAGNPSRFALPTTAFGVTPRRKLISNVLAPSARIATSRAVLFSSHTASVKKLMPR
jgi:hypothetical protein